MEHDERHLLVRINRNGRGNYNAMCSCGYRMLNSTPDLILRHTKRQRSSEQPPNDPNKRATHD